MVRKTVPFIDVYSQAFCYLDNDVAGRNAFAQMAESMPGKLVNCSAAGFLELHKDLNEYLQTSKMSR